MGFTLYDPNMNKLEFPVGVMPLDLFVSSTEKERLTANFEGIPGLIDYGFNYKTKDAKLTFWLTHQYGEHDYFLMKSDLESLLDSQKFFYVSHNALPTRIIKMTVDTMFQPERIVNSMYASLEVNCNVSGLPFWETKYTTQDIQTSGYNALVDKYGMADGINVDYLKYTFTENRFKVWNGGNVTIDPRNMPLKIELYNMATQGNLRIDNLTTGEYHVFYPSFSGNHYVLDGAIFRTASGTNRLRDTNRKYISLVPGLNEIKISNGTFDRAVFTFPFYYK
ncbi:phage tail domain-containing protein [Staphylococcus simulans]|uniref:phage tail domain-containing protein n=1 Tax=Staphylococcus simulans TaxID=1286 RepID=UPI001F54397C|nr:phage tail domain-containing protein [Staphylococcus simulans]